MTFAGWVAILLSTVQITHAQAPSPRGFQGEAEMESFVNGVIAAQQTSQGMAGAVVTVVADGRIYFSKGYGYADIAQQRPVDPQTTLFRIGSISQLFVATTVMQLWEQKRLNLDTDVNLYLRAFKVPSTFPRPITLSHLLGHTAGFEDRLLNIYSYDASNRRRLEQVLEDELPQRARPPGDVTMCSNHGYALAAFAVQQTVLFPWEDYLEQFVLTPLGMDHTTARQPVPSNLAQDLAIGYRTVQGRLEPTGFEFVSIGPAGALSASGHDMAQFMIANLQLGQHHDTRILAESTSQLMQSPPFSSARGINRMLHGFYEMDQNGERILGHRGGTISFHSHLALLPDQNTGVFIAYNSDTGATAISQFWQAFLHHYFPAAPTTQPAKPTTSILERMESLTGEYSVLLRSESTLTKLSSLLWTVQVELDADETLVTHGLGDAPRRWVEREPWLFQEIHGTRRIAFQVEEAGRATRLLSDLPFLSFERNPWHQTRLFHLATAGLSLLLLGSALVFWPVIAWCTKYGLHAERPPSMPRLWAWWMSLVFVLFFSLTALALRDPVQLMFGVPDLLRHALWLPIVGGFFLPLTLLFMLRAWVNSYWGFLGRIHYTLVTFAAAILLAWLWHWNLLGFRFYARGFRRTAFPPNSRVA
jgi:CubicO group peptidase (beta-lactamase class C family)